MLIIIKKVFIINVLFIVSIIGKAVIDPLPNLAIAVCNKFHLVFPDLSNKEAWTLKTSAG